MTATATRQAPRTETTAVATIDEKRALILQTVEKYAPSIEKLAVHGIEPGYFVESLRLHLAENPALLDCHPVSIARGILRLAQTGLELGVTADLLPFKSHCQFNARYQGLIELAIGAGCRRVEADVVYDDDEIWEWEKGTQSFLRHKHGRQEGKIIAAYALAEVKANAVVFDVLTIDEINATRKRYSKQWWWRDAKKKADIIPIEEIEWWAKKRTIRVLSSVLPKNRRFANALKIEQANDEDIPDGEYEILPDPPAGQSTTAPAATSAPASTERTPQRSSKQQKPGFHPIEDPYEHPTRPMGSRSIQIATDAQIKNLKDLAADPAINQEARDMIEKRIAKGLPYTVAINWINELTLAIANAKPQVPEETDSDELPLNGTRKKSIDEGIAENERRAEAVGL